MTEIYFNDLTARVGTATIALESVTATVIDLYVYWKPGFVIRLEAWRATSMYVDGLDIASEIDLTAATMAVGIDTLAILLWRQQASGVWYDIDCEFNDLESDATGRAGSMSDTATVFDSELDLYV